MAPFDLLEKAPLKSYSETVHGRAFTDKGLVSAATCTDCHGSHDLHAPTNLESKIYRNNIPKTCGKCHENVLKTYERSIHGKAAGAGKLETPVCTDCHGEHTIRGAKDPESSVYSTTLSVKTCGHCHAAEKITTKYRLPSDSVKTYLESYHGMANQYGVTTVANCASCHGAHNILPSSDPNSSVNERNLSKTCGKCHPNAGDQLAKGSVHLAPSPTQDRIIYYITAVYLTVIFLTIGGMLLHNGLDFLRKLRLHYLRKKTEATELRFTKVERMQHSILTLTFCVLAYTGFALKWPNAWWAFPFTLGHFNFDWRGVVHRFAAALFTLLALYHIFFLLFTERGRKQLKAFFFRKKDAKDFTQLMKYNLGKIKEKPKFQRYNYIEKMEYWALVWGSVVMIATGILMTFEDFTMRYFPKWILDVALTIHFYEAVLATLAIIVWHFYFTIFDPDHYPMNWSMKTGLITKEEERTDDDLKQNPS
ncbi:MAG: hypothetical protein COV74_02450 [Candidatus Omnitrophica bacterium CG11_big_fil_rev_8_21_14_0_20_45_26]|uniref:Uncharacterized protein n=1 Tax=Candidatus Abzuiibacterium crystallinum TaxID=1974748 RepID=A0A2H0LU49_9BACT|nr:MAG: hypothetical protein COV74_02450 [Candidatus Omnitrophica bacterium CG11_big_fil_rev_8_21_14_0_20_45_26]PIW65698.1 MAG: hypothetical protein COW12_00295 [Candidatus Omnitrophica bacterium CG12_big_fil_rev_8_21_14_0_65_45_16]